MTTVPNFQLQDAILGQTLSLAKLGDGSVQTPVVYSGIGPFTLTGEEFATALRTGIFLAGGVGIGTIQIILPSTTTLLNTLSYISVSNDSAQSFGAWASFKVINLDPVNSAAIVASDLQTGVNAAVTLPLSAQTYTVYETLQNQSSVMVEVVQNLRATIFPSPQFFTVNLGPPQTLLGVNAFPVPFDIVLAQSTLTDAVSYSLLNNAFSVSPGVTVLANATVVLNNTSTGFDTQPFLILATAGQVTSLPGNVIAGSASQIQISGSTEFALSVVYTNQTAAPTLWQVYVAAFASAVTTISADLATLNVSQIV